MEAVNTEQSDDRFMVEKIRQEAAERDRHPKPKAPYRMDFPVTELRSLRDLMEKNIPDPVVYIGDQETPLLSEGTTVLAAPPKLGKSWFCACLGIALTTGTSFLGLPAKKCHFLYCDLEQSDRIKQKRIRMILDALGVEAPDGFYIRDELQGIGRGFREQIESDLAADPEIGVIVIDIFSHIQTVRRNTDSEYSWTYQNFNEVNDLAKKHHVAFILVLHTRKQHDPDRPFDDILGSTANQGAASHMIVLSKEKTTDKKIHLYAQGRETEGMIELDYTNEKGVLTVIERDPDEPDELAEFMESEIRDAVVRLMKNTARWKGRCSGLIEECSRRGIGMDAGAREIGTFLGRNAGRLAKHDGISVRIIKNGTGPRIYELTKTRNDELTIGTIDEWLPADDEDPFETA